MDAVVIGSIASVVICIVIVGFVAFRIVKAINTTNSSD
jgi:large-conductance mechanosensitive channel